MGVDAIVESYGVVREQRLTDAIAPAEDAPIDDFVAALFLAPDASVVYDLGRPRTLSGFEVLSVPVAPRLETSADGERYDAATLAGMGRFGGMRRWGTRETTAPVRYVRVRTPEGSEGVAVGEIVAVADASREAPGPPALQTPATWRETVADLLSQRTRQRRLALALAIAAAAVFWFARRSAGRARVALSLTVVAMGLGSWIGFGAFRGDGRVLHPWEIAHYYLGPKYWPELGYRELYRCVARHERERGRGSLVDRGPIRDLDDYALHPGTWAQTPAGDCRARFAVERWRDFGRDSDRIRRLFDERHFHGLLRDHGYNGTPTLTAFVGSLANVVPPTRMALHAFAAVDIAALAVSVGALWWGFGPLPAALAAIVIGFGYPWEYDWIGGGIGRLWWFAMLCGGLSLLRKGQHGWAGFLIAAAGMLRLFPLVFLAGPGWRLLRRARSAGTAAADRRFAWGVAGALVAALFGASALLGPQVYLEFVEKMRLHASRPPGNEIGFAVLSDALAWPAMIEIAARVVALGAAVAFLTRVEQRGATLSELVAASAPLLFFSIPLAGYDYVWLAILAPVASTAAAAAALLVVVCTSKALPDLIPGLVQQHLAFSASLAVALPVILGRVAARRGDRAA